MIAVSSDGTAERIGDRFVGAEAVANEIVKRLMPNELPLHIGDFVRSLAKYGNVYWHTMIFGGATPLRMETVARSDGSIHLELADCNGVRIWQTDLRSAAA